MWQGDACPGMVFILIMFKVSQLLNMYLFLHVFEKVNLMVVLNLLDVGFHNLFCTCRYLLPPK